MLVEHVDLQPVVVAELRQRVLLLLLDQVLQCVYEIFLSVLAVR